MSKHRFLLRGTLLAFVWTCGVLPAMAQGVGAIGGTVMDSSGAVLPGATVTLSSAQAALSAESGSGIGRARRISVLTSRPRNLHRPGTVGGLPPGRTTQHRCHC